MSLEEKFLTKIIDLLKNLMKINMEVKKNMDVSFYVILKQLMKLEKIHFTVNVQCWSLNLL